MSSGPLDTIFQKFKCVPRKFTSCLAYKGLPPWDRHQSGFSLSSLWATINFAPCIIEMSNCTSVMNTDFTSTPKSALIISNSMERMVSEGKLQAHYFPTPAPNHICPCTYFALCGVGITQMLSLVLHLLRLTFVWTHATSMILQQVQWKYPNM